MSGSRCRLRRTKRPWPRHATLFSSRSSLTGPLLTSCQMSPQILSEILVPCLKVCQWIFCSSKSDWALRSYGIVDRFCVFMASKYPVRNFTRYSAPCNFEQVAGTEYDARLLNFVTKIEASAGQFVHKHGSWLLNQALPADSWGLQSRWAVHCRGPASVSTSRSAWTSLVRCLALTALWSPTRPTSPSTWAPCQKQCASRYGQMVEMLWSTGQISKLLQAIDSCMIRTCTA